MNEHSSNHTSGGEPIERRSFLEKMLSLVGWGAFGIWVAGLGGAAARFFFPRVVYEPPTSFKIGKPADYLMDTVDSRWLKEHRIYIVRKMKGIYAISASCTHLGCNVTWFDFEGKFKCPCHGSFFTLDGDVIGGPAPEPLFRVGIAYNQDGDIVVDTATNENDPAKREKGNYMLKT